MVDADDLLDDDRAFVESGVGLLVHTSVAEQFVGQVRPLAVGERASGENAEVDPLVSKAHFDRVTGYLERAGLWWGVSVMPS
ncbi:hypothetical protein [Streptomyces sp. NBC_01235]|uniref:hypothetical protein n=1 Tax=Streptomyces sp. NBC_01235 TaxID=2903788 RepID=UPI002E13AF90|nr:hypothetical protein OG289_00765 [Streptomyces sp. NBC_01235]